MREKTIIQCCLCKKKRDSRNFYITRSHMLYSTEESKMQVCSYCMTKIFLEHLNNFYNGNIISALKYMCLRFDVYYNNKIAKDSMKHPVNKIWGYYLRKIALPQYQFKTFENNLIEGIELNIINTERVKRIIRAGGSYNQ